MIFTLRNAEINDEFGDFFAADGFHDIRRVCELHAFKELSDLLFGDRMLKRDTIDFRDVFFRMREPMNQFSVIGQQKQSRCIFIETADRLDFPHTQRRRQQREHTRMMNGL